MLSLGLVSKGLAAALVASLVVIACQAVTIAERGEALADLRADHAELVATAERARAAQSEKYRQLEQQREGELTVLRTMIGDEHALRQAADADARTAGDRLRITLAAAAELAGRTPENPAAAGRADATCAVTAELLGEAAATAGELAQEAGRHAATVMGLQHYVRHVCLTHP